MYSERLRRRRRCEPEACRGRVLEKFRYWAHDDVEPIGCLALLWSGACVHRGTGRRQRLRLHCSASVVQPALQHSTAASKRPGTASAAGCHKPADADSAPIEAVPQLHARARLEKIQAVVAVHQEYLALPVNEQAASLQCIARCAAFVNMT